MISRIILFFPMALLLIGCSLGYTEGVAEQIAQPILRPTATATPFGDMLTVEAIVQSTRVAVSGLEGTTVAVEATTQSLNQQATLDAAAAVHAADAATATALAQIPTATAQALETRNQAAVIAQQTAAATRIVATEVAAVSTAEAATVAAGAIAIQETSVAIRGTAAYISIVATQDAQRAITLAAEERLRQRQEQIALDRSLLFNRFLRYGVATAPFLLALAIALLFYRERRRTAPQLVPAGTHPIRVVTAPALRPERPAVVATQPPLTAGRRTAHIAAPEWASLGHWRGRGLPLGVDNSGLLIAPLTVNPHLLFFGTTGNCMTRFGLRPVVAAALGNGWHVSIFDRSGWDYLPFDDHKNAALFTLGHARELVTYMRAVCQEVQIRLELQKAESTETAACDRANCLVIVDQFSKLISLLDRRDCAELWQYTSHIAADGHKVGIHLAIACQDPVPESIDLRVRRHCLPIAFRLKDEGSSRAMLGISGAEALTSRHFIALMPDLVRGVSFAPSDAELQLYLAKNRVSWVDAPIWARAVRAEVVGDEKATVMSFGALPVNGEG